MKKYVRMFCKMQNAISYQMFRKLIKIRCEHADSLGYSSYIDLGGHKVNFADLSVDLDRVLCRNGC